MLGLECEQVRQTRSSSRGKMRNKTMAIYKNKPVQPLDGSRD